MIVCGCPRPMLDGGGGAGGAAAAAGAGADTLASARSSPATALARRLIDLISRLPLWRPSKRFESRWRRSYVPFDAGAIAGARVESRGMRRAVRTFGPPLLGVAAMAGLLVVLDPAQVARALTRFDLRLLPAILAMYVAWYVLQGWRWHILLREAGARVSLTDSLLLNAAGQTITALVPLGDLTRAAFAARASDRDFGSVAATVTVQELTYTLCLVLLALPELLALHLGVGVVAATAAGMAAVVVILTVSPVFCVVHRLIARIPLLNRLLPAIDELQHETAELLHRPETLATGGRPRSRSPCPRSGARSACSPAAWAPTRPPWPAC
ncbi:MAG: flippase-like domain-containing protein [Chloroflexi bacterium]|nr:MAG: flippase-like domain-containing protein [Chloroflexota bacterium]